MKILGITVSKNLAEPKSPYLFPMHTCTYERLAGATDQNNINERLAASSTASAVYHTVVFTAHGAPSPAVGCRAHRCAASSDFASQSMTPSPIEHELRRMLSAPEDP